MSSSDNDLLRVLAEADAMSPPPAGDAITPHGLLAIEARRTRRRLGALAVLSIAVLSLVLCWPRPQAGAADDGGVRADLWHQEQALRIDVQRLQAQLARLAAAFDAPGRTRADVAADQLRYELASARAMAVLAGPPSLPKENR